MSLTWQSGNECVSWDAVSEGPSNKPWTCELFVCFTKTAAWTPCSSKRKRGRSVLQSKTDFLLTLSVEWDSGGPKEYIVPPGWMIREDHSFRTLFSPNCLKTVCSPRVPSFPALPPLVSPSFFFLREFFSRALLSERLEQAIKKHLLNCLYLNSISVSVWNGFKHQPTRVKCTRIFVKFGE